jgi:gluconolactonase
MKNIWILICIFFFTGATFAQITSDVPVSKPAAVINLATREGISLVRGAWRYSDANVIEVNHHSVGPDLKPSGPPNRTYDITPKAGASDFDDSNWTLLDPEELMSRRSTGLLSFNWYRLQVTIPEKIGKFDPTGSDVVFEIVVDDYSEVWVNGKLPLVLGQTGGQLIKGFNSPNRVLLAHDAKPGQKFQIAVFGANGPLSNPPGNFIWVRSATLDFFKPGQSGNFQKVKTVIDRKDPLLDEIVAANAQVEKVAGGFEFIEGPIWFDDGYLLFSDPNNNVIYRWSPDGQVSVYRTKSGYSGTDIGEYGQPGSNGLTLDQDGRLTIAEHGNHRISRLEKNGVLTVLADRYEGKRLNSPNDLVYKSDGTLYFTDPPFGLPKFYDDSRKELPYSGIFCLKDGKLKLLNTDLLGPNGLAFSPDEKYLYVGNWDVKKKAVTRFPVLQDGTLGEGELFFDMTSAAGEEALDGLKVDKKGNLYVSGPGGVWILSSEGKHLGTLQTPELPANFAWGDADGKTLYMTSRSSLYRIRINVEGVRP